MTPRQQQLLAFIGEYHRAHAGVSPSFDEMALGLGLASKNSVHRLLAGLEESRLIMRSKNRSRRITIVQHNELSMVRTDALLDELEARGINVGHIRPVQTSHSVAL